MYSNFEIINEDEMLEIDGGIPFWAIGLGFLGISAVICTINGYIDESLK